MRQTAQTEVEIRPLTTEEEFAQAVELQKIVWKLPDYLDCVPTHVMRAAAETGGVVLGAYVQEAMVGFLLALPANDAEVGFHHHSHILGILPQWAHKKIGFLLKRSHYHLAKEQGIPLITWTYDPLMGPNANLNIRKLGATACKYKVNYYGETMGGSKLVGGIPSDRFWAEWWIGSRHAEDHLSGKQRHWKLGGDLPVVNRVADDAGVERIIDFSIPKEATSLAVRIPADFQAIMDTDRNLALDWRLKSRALFQQCFQAGFAVVDFIRQADEKGMQNLYILEKTQVRPSF